MEVRIGVQNSAREVVIEAVESIESIQQKIDDALNSGKVLSLSDEKGRTVVVPAATIAYVDIAASEARKVGFGA
jgi:ArsR family metal-binding transcriptional regulator